MVEGGLRHFAKEEKGHTLEDARAMWFPEGMKRLFPEQILSHASHFAFHQGRWLSVRKPISLYNWQFTQYETQSFWLKTPFQVLEQKILKIAPL